MFRFIIWYRWDFLIVISSSWFLAAPIQFSCHYLSSLLNYVSHGLTCSRGLMSSRASCVTCSCTLRTSCLTCSRTSRVLYHTYLRAWYSSCLNVLSSFTCLVLCLLSCLTCSRVSRVLRILVSHMSCVLCFHVLPGRRALRVFSLLIPHLPQVFQA